MKNIKAMLVDTLKVHEYDVFALRPLDIKMFNELYETICGLSVLCNEGKALTATIATPLGGGMPMRSTSSSSDGTGAAAGRGAGACAYRQSVLNDQRRAAVHCLFIVSASMLCPLPCLSRLGQVLVRAVACGWR